MKSYKNSILLIICILCFFLGAIYHQISNKIIKSDVESAEKLIGIDFSEPKIDSMLSLLDDQKQNFENMRKLDLPNSVPPAFNFNPIPLGKTFKKKSSSFKVSNYSLSNIRGGESELQYYSIGYLAELIRTRKMTSVELTKFFLERLKKYGPMLHCVITYTDSIAYQQARESDAEIESGHYRGLLHGIPFGIKDMYSTKNYPTTYGTPPYKDQIIDEDATIVKKLHEAGAVLIAKLSLGELAMDDIWFGGLTRNPWDTSKGSSGSSAGPAASVSAGLIPFAIGSETWGSIVSPSTVCGVTGLRPSFGMVSRYGAMALSWTMDKVGPICRNAEDCAIVFNAIYGADGKDQAMIEMPFNYSPDIDFHKLKIGIIKEDFEKDTSINKPFNNAAIEELKKLGAELIPVKLPDLPVNDISIILMCEAASAFDELTLTNKDDLMVQQNKYRWPNFFRAAHFIPATEYIRANRLRYILIQEMNKIMSQIDLIVAPSLAGDNLLVTNLTGHPCVVIPNGFIDEKTPTSIVFIGQLFDEGRLLAAAKKYQDVTGFHLKHPEGYN